MERAEYCENIQLSFAINPIIGILGPRQCGKTTLAKQYVAKFKDNYKTVSLFDLEDALDLQRLENPRIALEKLQGLIVIDEIQLRPDLFPILRVLIDQNRDKQKYLILGSASRELLRQSAETLAGRISYMELTPFQATEVDDLDKLWYRGGFPLSYLAADQQLSYKWREAYIRTFLEQDIPALGFNITTGALRRFWAMLTHYHGQAFNANELGNSLDISHNTVRKYLDILVGTFMIRELQPWFENLKKRQVKAPKIYFRDSGVYHTLCRILDFTQLMENPKLGASWEGFALETIINKHHTEIDKNDCYFWGTHAGAELDLMILNGDTRWGFEFKFNDVPKISKSMRIACDELKLDGLTIIYPGTQDFTLEKNIKAKGLKNYISLHGSLAEIFNKQT